MPGALRCFPVGGASVGGTRPLGRTAPRRPRNPESGRGNRGASGDSVRGSLGKSQACSERRRGVFPKPLVVFAWTTLCLLAIQMVADRRALYPPHYPQRAPPSTPRPSPEPQRFRLL